jgi:thiol:disulfide interchange protein DsbA
MKHLVKAAVIALFMPLLAVAEPFEEGVHYEVISDRGTKGKEVNEFFSFYCPACNRMEGAIAEIKPQLNKDIKFRKTHVNFMGGRTKENQDMLSQALATAEAFPEQKDKIIAGIFGHYHAQRKSFNEVSDVRDIFVQNGVEGEKFDKFYASFSVKTKAKKMEKDQTVYSDKGALKSVPTFIVNGKYRVIFGGKSVSSAEDMAKLINYLAEK